ncbi:hypothetical protein [Psychrobacter sp. I-STPA10]|uniref:hypothetical protein n=1 Tax=Psychrobacter sp. I-STPA10 TaxID=2585769 RepID=UPI001E606048|nr:hypothetical protein [Psychrobacter sp. I-STPA10]
MTYDLVIRRQLPILFQLSILILPLLPLLLTGCQKGDFIAQIEQLDKPKGFEQVTVNEQLDNHVLLGMNENELLTFLDNNDFDTFEDKQDKKCPKAEKVYISVYEFKNNLSFPANYRLAGYFCFQDKKLTHKNMLYIKHNY